MEGIPTIADWEIAARVMLALILCGALGLERERLGQVAGMRTHILVGVGSALFTLVSAYAFSGWILPNPGGAPLVQVDPSRVAAQIVAGIGFLGAGAIITQGVTVRGLTTAATLWISAAIGMAAGIGFYFAAIFVAVVIVISLIGVRRLRVQVAHQIRSNIVFLEARVKSSKKLGYFLALLGSKGVSLQRMDPLKKRRYRFELLVPAEITIDEIEDYISEMDGVSLRAIRSARADAGDDE